MSSAGRAWMNLLALLTERYFRPRETEVAIYRRLGVRRFKRYLPTGGDIYANRTGWHPILHRSSGLVPALSRLEKRTRLAESAHVLTFLFFATVTYRGLAAGGRLVPVILLTLFNVGFNIYPIMVQRYNRHRILRLLERRNAALRDAHAGEARSSNRAGPSDPPS